MNKALIASLTLLLMTGCTWVQPTARGDMVRLAAAPQVVNCEKIGDTTVSVLAKVGFLNRSKAKVEEELATLASTSAADMGGDTIVPISEVVDGERKFAVYRCSTP